MKKEVSEIIRKINKEEEEIKSLEYLKKYVEEASQASVVSINVQVTWKKNNECGTENFGLRGNGAKAIVDFLQKYYNSICEECENKITDLINELKKQ